MLDPPFDIVMPSDILLPPDSEPFDEQLKQRCLRRWKSRRVVSSSLVETRHRRFSWQEKRKWTRLSKDDDLNEIPPYPSTRRINFLQLQPSDLLVDHLVAEDLKMLYDDPEEAGHQEQVDLQRAIVLSLSPDSQERFVGSSRLADW
jgi:hypothetical protein